MVILTQAIWRFLLVRVVLIRGSKLQGPRGTDYDINNGQGIFYIRS